MRIGPLQQTSLERNEPGARQCGLTLEFAVAGPLVVVHAARLGREQQRVIVFDEMAQMGSNRRRIGRGTGQAMQSHQRQRLLQDFNAEL